MYPNQPNPYGRQPQQGQNGQYEVVPPLPAATNGGHSGHNPYDFIVNPNTPKAQRGMFGGGGSLTMRLVIVSVVAVVLIIAGVVAASLLGPKSITPNLTAIAQRQQEIIRLSEEAGKNISGQDTQNFASNIELSVSSSQQQLLTYLAANGTDLKAKELAAKQSSQTDTLLDNAKSAGTYDSVVVQTLTDELQTYESLLQTTYKEASGAKAKQVLKDCFTSADALLQQAKDIAAAS
jgi:hypothetical protein